VPCKGNVTMSDEYYEKRKKVSKVLSTLIKILSKMYNSKVIKSLLAAVAAMAITLLFIYMQNVRIRVIIICGLLVFISVLFILSVNRYRWMAYIVLNALTLNNWLIQKFASSLQVEGNIIFKMYMEFSSSIEPYSLTLCFIALLGIDIFDRKLFSLLQTRTEQPKAEEVGRFFVLVESIFKPDIRFEERIMKIAMLLKSYPGYYEYLRSANIIFEADSNDNLRFKLGLDEDHKKMSLVSKVSNVIELDNIPFIKSPDSIIELQEASTSYPNVLWKDLENYFIQPNYKILEVHGGKVIMRPGKGEKPSCSIRISQNCSSHSDAVIIRPYLILIEQAFDVKIEDILHRQN